MTTETEIPEGCLPFDLEKARAGRPCRTRDGRVARYMGETQSGNGHGRNYPVVWGISKGNPVTTTEEGVSLRGGKSGHDVFLTAPEWEETET